MSISQNAQHKRAERERRKDAGEVRCEVWLDRLAQEDLARIMRCRSMNKEDAIHAALGRFEA